MTFYEYKLNSHFLPGQRANKTLADKTPDVYYDFLWKNKVKFNG